MKTLDIEWCNTLVDITENEDNLTACIRQEYLEWVN